MKTRYSLIAVAMLAAMLVLQSNPVRALEPAPLAAGSRLVDDDGQQCPTAGYSTISAALADAPSGSTVTICAGTYTEQLVINSMPGLKLIGKDMPHIVAPSNIDGAVILFQNSDDVTVQGLLVDGGRTFSSSSTWMAGIAFQNATGTVSGNVIQHIRHFIADSKPQGAGIQVFAGAPGKPRGVKILNNTIIDFQYAGIWVAGNYSPTISRNLIQTVSDANQPSGILLSGLSGGSVSDNIIANNYGFQNLTFNTGINLLNSSHIKVASNTITGSRLGVYVQGVEGAADANTISGNRMLDCGGGVLLFTVPGGTASANSVTKNQILSTGYWNTSASSGVIVDGGASAAGNKITSNTIQGYASPGITDRGTGTAIRSNKWSLFATPGA